MKNLTKLLRLSWFLYSLKGLLHEKISRSKHNSQALFNTRFSNGATQSVMILLEGSTNAGTGCNLDLGMAWLGFPTT